MYPAMLEWWRSYWLEMVFPSPAPAEQTFDPYDPIPSYNIRNWPFETALCLIDEELRIAETSHNFTKIIDRLPEVGKEFHELLTKDVQKQFFFLLQQALHNTTEESTILKARLAGGERRFIEMIAVPQKQGILLTMRDATRETEQERELARAQINAELALRARSEFLGRMSHELRTPLNAVIGFTQMIEGEVNGPLNHPVYEEYIRSILESGEHLLEKIDNLVAISEAELGGIVLKESECSVAGLLRNASGHHQHYAFSKDIQMDVVLAEEDSPLIFADPSLMTKALSNLIENALSATEKGGKVRLTASISPTNEILIQVIDSGIGMSENLVKCLQSFFEGAMQSCSHFEQVPLGTGLVLVREYCLLHQGRVTLDSERGKGAIFTVALPAARLLATGSDRQGEERFRRELLGAIAV